jgi:phage terminase large subunit
MRTVEEHCDNIRPFIEAEGIEYAVCDHDAENRAVLERKLGIKTVAAKKAIKLGINAMQNRFKPLGDNRPGIVAFRNCLLEEDMDLRKKHHPLGLEQEVYYYTWDEDYKKGEKPIDKYNHSMDCARYAVMYKDNFNNVTISTVSNVAKSLILNRGNKFSFQ